MSKKPAAQPIKPRFFISNFHLVVYISAIIVYTITAYFSNNYYCYDEYFQIMQFALHHISPNSNIFMPWEFSSQIRPTIQVWLVIIICKIFNYISASPNPYIIAFTIRLIAAYFSLIALIIVVNTLQKELNSTYKKNWLLLLSLFSWIIVFNSVRFSGEDLAGSIFVIGLSLLLNANKRSTFIPYIMAGLILGIAFITRFQTGFMLFGLGAWLVFIKRTRFNHLLAIAIGIAITILFGLAIDSYFYGDLVFTPWQYFSNNILLHVASRFGTSPWYYYLQSTALLYPYGACYIIASLFFIIREPKHVISWLIVPFFVAHSIVGHKEMRFLLPILPFMPFVMIKSYQLLQQSKVFIPQQLTRQLNILFWIVNCLIVVDVMFYHTNLLPIKLHHTIYKRYSKPTTVFYQQTPFDNWAMPLLSFYDRDNVSWIKIDSIDQINNCPSNQNCILIKLCGYYDSNANLTLFDTTSAKCNNERCNFTSNIPPKTTYNLKAIYSECRAPFTMPQPLVVGWQFLYNVYEINNIESNPGAARNP